MARRLCAVPLLPAASALSAVRKALSLSRIFFSTSPPTAAAAAAAEPLAVALDAWGTCLRDPHKPGATAPQPWRGVVCGALDCGEDSFFVSPRVLGIADGVGGWRNEGVDPAVFANHLMRHCQRLVESAREYDPLALIRRAFAAVQASPEVRAGGSTVCVAALWPRRTLRTANLGDSGCLVARGGECVFRAEERSWQFNTPHQLAVAPRGWNAVSNRPDESAVADFTLEAGDVVVLGTDGLLDNLFPKQIAALVAAGLAQGLSVRELAEALRDAAAQASLLRTGPSPFQQTAAQHGLRHQGGKPDDITVVVAKVIPQPPPPPPPSSPSSPPRDQ